MKLYKSDKVRFIFGLIIIIIIYSWNYLYFIESDIALLIPRKTRNLIKFSITIVVYFVGTFHLGKLKDTWMSNLWHLIHISGLCIITSLGLFDWLITELTLSIKQFALNIQELLISPVLYFSMGVLNKSLKKGSNG